MLRRHRKQEDLRLRLSVTSGGCEGFSYVFSFADGQPENGDDDVLVGRDLVIDGVSLDLVRGATIDFEDDIIRSGFVVVQNPNSQSSCGCGSSFSLK